MMPDEKTLIEMQHIRPFNDPALLLFVMLNITEMLILHIMNSNDVRLQMLRNAYSTGQMLDSIDLRGPRFESLTTLRVEACANNYHGDSWPQTTTNLAIKLPFWCKVRPVFSALAPLTRTATHVLHKELKVESV